MSQAIDQTKNPKNDKEQEIKKKILTEKEIIDFLIMIEEKYEFDETKLNEFRDIFMLSSGEDNTKELSIEDKLLNCQSFLIKYPFLIMEFNKILPKSYKLAILNTDFAKSFLLKLKRRDEGVFEQIVTLLDKQKRNEIDFENLLRELEEHLVIYPDLYDEMLIIMDVKKYLKTRGARDGKRGFQLGSLGLRKMNHSGSFINPNVFLNGNELESSYNIKDEPLSAVKDKDQDVKRLGSYREEDCNKNKLWNKESGSVSDPEFLFFESLKNLISPQQYTSFIKLLFLYTKGIISHFEFCHLIDSLIDESELTGVLKQLTMSKLISRKHNCPLIKPLTEVDMSKFKKITTSYYDYKGEHYYNTQASGQIKKGMTSLFNNRYISVPNGSEDDKNPLKKNHYEENIFKYEDQRYELDMLIDGLKFCLEEFSEKEKKALTGQTIQILKKVYKEFFQQIYDSYIVNPVEISEIIVERLKKRIQEALSQKAELDKTIRASFDRFYSKSFDYRSFKFKNNEKKYTNPKAFIKEITKRSLDKLNTNNVNILKGGTENSEFFTSFPSKFNSLYYQPQVNKQDNSLSSCLFTDLNQNDFNEFVNSKKINVDLNNFKKCFPDLRFNFSNKIAFKTCIYVIFSYVDKYFKSDEKKIIKNYLIFLFEQFLSTKINISIDDEGDDNTNEDEFCFNDYIELNHLEELKNNKASPELIKIMEKLLGEIENNSRPLDSKEYTPNRCSFFNSTARKATSIKSEDESLEMTITPSLCSNNEHSYKKSLCSVLNNKSNIFDYCSEKGRIKYIPKENSIENNILFCSEQLYVIIRYIFCIYERLSKLTESSQIINKSLLTKPASTSILEKNVIEKGLDMKAETEVDSIVKIKHFLVLFNAFVNKKIDNSNQFEELCRDILANDSYYLLNFDKLLISLSKLIINLPNEVKVDDMIDLYFREKQRKTKPNEEAYFTIYLNLVNNIYNKHFRLLFNKENMILTCHYIESDDKLKQIKDDYMFLKDYNGINSQVINKTLGRENFEYENNLSFHIFEGSNKISYINGDFLYFNNKDNDDTERYFKNRITANDMLLNKKRDKL